MLATYRIGGELYDAKDFGLNIRRPEELERARFVKFSIHYIVGSELVELIASQLKKLSFFNANSSEDEPGSGAPGRAGLCDRDDHLALIPIFSDKQVINQELHRWIKQDIDQKLDRLELRVPRIALDDYIGTGIKGEPLTATRGDCKSVAFDDHKNTGIKGEPLATIEGDCKSVAFDNNRGTGIKGEPLATIKGGYKLEAAFPTTGIYYKVLGHQNFLSAFGHPGGYKLEAATPTIGVDYKIFDHQDLLSAFGHLGGLRVPLAAY